MRQIAASLLLLSTLVVGCDRSPATSGPSADAEHTEEAPRELTPRQKAVQIRSEIAVTTAIERASTAALRDVEKQGKEVSKKPPADVASAATTKFTVFFGGNNHGERNDCGCRKNPLGGLGRRHLMYDALTDDRAAEIWGDAGSAAGPVFHVDAGDMFFRNNTVDRGDMQAQKAARYDAVSVSRALETLSLDAIAVGEHDLVFGADYLRTLTKQLDAPLLSANLRDKAGELVFQPSVIVERDGVKVAFVGLTKSDSRRKDYFESRELTVDDPQKAATDAISSLGDHDAVVLLSNLGLVETRALVGELAKRGTRVELAAASSTNRMTGDPEFVAGIPVMEPLSRGKYLGRADIWLAGEEVAYRNASIATPSSMRDYRRSVRSYWTTRKQVLRQRLKVAEAEMALETLETGQQPDTGEVVGELRKRREHTLDAQKKRLETLDRRLESTSSGLLKTLPTAVPPGEKPMGDDWIAGYVVPVKIEFEPDPATRRVIDPREKKRPEASPR